MATVSDVDAAVDVGGTLGTLDGRPHRNLNKQEQHLEDSTREVREGDLLLGSGLNERQSQSPEMHRAAGPRVT